MKLWSELGNCLSNKFLKKITCLDSRHCLQGNIATIVVNIPLYNYVFCIKQLKKKVNRSANGVQFVNVCICIFINNVSIIVVAFKYMQNVF